MKLYELRMMLYVDTISEEFKDSELIVAESEEEATKELYDEVILRMLEPLQLGEWEGLLSYYSEKVTKGEKFTTEDIRSLGRVAEDHLGWRYFPGWVAEVDTAPTIGHEEYCRVAVYSRDNDEWLEYNNMEEEIEHLKKCINESLLLQDQLEEELKRVTEKAGAYEDLVERYQRTIGEIDDLATQIHFHTRKEVEDEDTN